MGRNNKHIEWCIVRPDTLINADVSPYYIKESPKPNAALGYWLMFQQVLDY